MRHDPATQDMSSLLKAIGHVAEIWRYPVSSLGGQLCADAPVEQSGIEGDRRFGLFDPETGEVASPETQARWRPSLFLQSFVTSDGSVLIRFPDDRDYNLRDDALKFRLHEHFGFEVSIGRYASETMKDYDSLPEIKGRYDVAPLHVVTTASLRELEKICGFAIDQKRFRPSILISLFDKDGFQETDWENCTLHIGAVRAPLREGTKRCGMTFIAQSGLSEEPEILRNTVRHNKRRLGIYCDVAQTGVIEAGAAVFLETPLPIIRLEK